MSVHVSFCRQALGGGRELHFVCPAHDHAITWLDSTLQSHPIAITSRHFDVPARKLFTADLDPDVRAAGFSKDRLLGHGGHLHAISLIENGSRVLAYEKLPTRIHNLELHWKGAGLFVHDTGIVHVFRTQRQPIRTTGDLERDVCNSAHC